MQPSDSIHDERSRRRVLFSGWADGAYRMFHALQLPAAEELSVLVDWLEGSRKELANGVLTPLGIQPRGDGMFMYAGDEARALLCETNETIIYAVAFWSPCWPLELFVPADAVEFLTAKRL